MYSLERKQRPYGNGCGLRKVVLQIIISLFYQCEQIVNGLRCITACSSDDHINEYVMQESHALYCKLEELN